MKTRFNQLSRKLLIILLIALLILIVPIGVKRVTQANEHLSIEAIQEMAGIYGIATDRFGQTIFDGQTKNPVIFGNLIYSGKMSANAVAVKYNEELSPGKVNYISGYRSMETQPRVMKTTLLSVESQQKILDLYGSKTGCCFAYNYKTGEVYMAFSLPSSSPTSASPSYINRCVSSTYIPGSTMKMATSLIAIEQGIALDKVSYVCEGSYTLPDGNKINCHSTHGKQSFIQGLGNSCNCFFAQLIMTLDLDEAIETLKELGFSVNEDEAEKGKLDRLTKVTSSADITDTASFKNVWGLIGQGNTLVNAVDMAMIAGAIANGGSTAEPYIVESVTNPNKEDKIIYEAEKDSKELLTEKTAEKMQEYWKTAVENFYHPAGFSERITYAKTGTAQINNKGGENKTLVGVIEESDTAFYIVVENYKSGDTAPVTIANMLASLLPKK